MATFSEAIKAMVEGKAIRRKGWNPCVTQNPIYKNYGIKHYRPGDNHRSVDGDGLEHYQMEWLVSDMVADDWEILDAVECR